MVGVQREINGDQSDDEAKPKGLSLPPKPITVQILFGCPRTSSSSQSRLVFLPGGRSAGVCLRSSPSDCSGRCTPSSAQQRPHPPSNPSTHPQVRSKVH